MSHEYTSWAWAQEIKPPGAKFVLVAIADSANADGYAYPGQKRLAKMTGQEERTVRRHAAWLEEHGYVRRSERRRNDGSRTSDGYHLPPKVDEDLGKIGPLWPVPNDTTGQSGRLEPTGQNVRTPRPETTGSPAKLTGHESSGEPSDEPKKEEDPRASMGFGDQQALVTLQRSDREAHKLLEIQGGQLGWKYRHKNLAAARILSSRRPALAALAETLKGANASGASAYRYFETILDNPQPKHRTRPPAPAGRRASSDVTDLASKLKGECSW